VWIGISNVNTFSTAAAIAFSTDLKTLPLAGFFGITADITDMALCFSPNQPNTLPDVIGKSLVDEIVPGHSFKAMTLKEFLKFGVSIYDK
jgi:hypothetical protein